MIYYRYAWACLQDMYRKKAKLPIRCKNIICTIFHAKVYYNFLLNMYPPPKANLLKCVFLIHIKLNWVL